MSPLDPQVLPQPPAFARGQLTPAEAEACDAGTLALAQVLTSAHGMARVLGTGVDADRWCQSAGPVRRQGVTVGDWALVDPRPDPPLLTRRLDPRTVLRRRDPEGGSQIVACNLDVAFICTAVGHDLNVRRVERWGVLCAEAGIRAVVLLTKADAGVDVQPSIDALAALPDLPVLPVSALEGRGLDAVRLALPADQLGALLGSSGVGKSTLVNALLQQEAQETAAVREADDRGRHTTTARHLFALPWGAFLIDNPGTREVGLVDADGLADAFPEIDGLATQCRWRDCTHTGDQGCAIQGALDDGALDPARHAAWQRLRDEATEAAAKAERIAAARARREQGRRRKKAAPKRRR